MTNRVLLCIMDGWGISTGSEKYDATKLSNPVNVPKLEREEKFVHIKADGENVGLPAGQMGNSEVGHLNLGAGRIVYQDLSKINNAIKMAAFSKTKDLWLLLNTRRKIIQHYTCMDLFQQAAYIHHWIICWL